MEWLTLHALWGVHGAMPGMWNRYYDYYEHYERRFEQPGTDPEAGPTELDLAVLKTLYEAIAAGTYCARCGATLGRRLRLVSPSRPVTETGSWRLLVVTRCYGFFRHAFAADVIEVAGDLRIGQFGPV